MSSIYRYIPFFTLFDILKNSHLTFVRPALWEDPFEGFLFRKHKTTVGQQQIREYVLRFQNQQYYSLLELTLNNFERMFFAQSWSKSNESDAIWNTYGYENSGIRIEMDQEYFTNIDFITRLEAEYVQKLSLEDDLIRVGIKEGKTDLKKLYKFKREAFSYEKEIRFIYEDRNQVNERVGETKDVSIDTKEIKSVLVHPKAKEYYVDIVRQLCTLYEVPFIGKSKLYTFEIE